MTSKLIRTPLFATRPKLQSLISSLHQISLEQEKQNEGSQNAGTFYPKNIKDEQELVTFKGKLVALEEDKASAMYMMLRAANAQRIFEGAYLWYLKER